MAGHGNMMMANLAADPQAMLEALQKYDRSPPRLFSCCVTKKNFRYGPAPGGQKMMNDERQAAVFASETGFYVLEQSFATSLQTCLHSGFIAGYVAKQQNTAGLLPNWAVNEM